MAKRRTIRNPRGKTGTKAKKGQPVQYQKPPFESVILCDISGGSDEFRNYYLNCSTADKLSEYDPGEAEDRDKLIEQWKLYVAHRQMFESTIINILTVGGSITLGKTIVEVMDQAYIIEDEHYKFDPQNMILRRILRLVKVDTSKLN